jgi:hypothetical protein
MGGEVYNVTAGRPLLETLFWQLCRTNNRGLFCSRKPDTWPSAGSGQVRLTYPEDGRAIPGTAQFCINYLNWADYFSSPHNTEGLSFQTFIDQHALLKADEKKNLESLKRIAQFCRDVDKEENEKLQKSRGQEVPAPPQTTPGTPPPPPPDIPPDEPEKSRFVWILGAAALITGLAVLINLLIRRRDRTKKGSPPVPVSAEIPHERHPMEMDARVMRVPSAEQIRLGEINAGLSADRIIFQLFLANPKTAGLTPLEKTEIAHEIESAWRRMTLEQQIKYVDLHEKYEEGMLPKTFLMHFLGENYSPEQRRAQVISKLLHDSFVVPQLIRIANSDFKDMPYARLEALPQDKLIELSRLAIAKWRSLKPDMQANFIDLVQTQEQGELPDRFAAEFLKKSVIEWYYDIINAGLADDLVKQQLMKRVQFLDRLSDEDLPDIVNDAALAWKSLLDDEKKKYIDAADPKIFEGYLPQAFIDAYVGGKNRIRCWEARAINKIIDPQKIILQIRGLKPVAEHISSSVLRSIADYVISSWRMLSLEEQAGYLTGEIYPIGGLPAKAVAEFMEKVYEEKAWIAHAITNTANPQIVDLQFRNIHRDFLHGLDMDIKRPEAGTSAILRWRAFPAQEQIMFVEPMNNGVLGFHVGELPEKFIKQYLDEWLVLAFNLNIKENGVFWQLLLTSREIYDLQHKTQERIARDAIEAWKSLPINEKVKFINPSEPMLSPSLLAGRLPQRFIVKFIEEYLAKNKGGSGQSSGNPAASSGGTPPPPPQSASQGGGTDSASAVMHQSPVIAGAASLYAARVQPFILGAPNLTIFTNPLLSPSLPALI